MRVAIVSCRDLPEPDADEALYAPALWEHHLRAEIVPWDGARVKWDAYALCVLRSTWDYHHHPDAFVAWAERVGATTRLANPASVVRWNVHKRYLLELEQKGIPVVPTALVRRGEKTTLGEIARAHGFGPLVVKPAVSAGSFRTTRVGESAQERSAGEAAFAALVAERDVLVQSYMKAVEGPGERAIVCIDGSPTHAVRKSPRFGDDAESVSRAMPVSPGERAFAQRVLAAVETPEPLLYARVDVVRDGEALRLMELELIEPSLFFQQYPRALKKFAAALAARIYTLRAGAARSEGFSLREVGLTLPLRAGAARSEGFSLREVGLTLPESWSDPRSARFSVREVGR